MGSQVYQESVWTRMKRCKENGDEVPVADNEDTRWAARQASPATVKDLTELEGMLHFIANDVDTNTRRLNDVNDDLDKFNVRLNELTAYLGRTPLGRAPDEADTMTASAECGPLEATPGPVPPKRPKKRGELLDPKRQPLTVEFWADENHGYAISKKGFFHKFTDKSKEFTYKISPIELRKELESLEVRSEVVSNLEALAGTMQFWHTEYVKENAMERDKYEMGG